MVMYSMLRRASSSVFPLSAVRAIASSRTFHSALPHVRTLESVGLTHGSLLRDRALVPSLRFANAFATKPREDENLVQVLENEIRCVYDDEHTSKDGVEIPDDFPFEIENNPGERTILLKRQYQDETIKVQVDIPNVAPEENENEDDGEKNDSESSIPLVVTIFKGDGLCLEFGVTAFPDEISIDSLSIKQSDESEDQLAYEGPDFNDLDENLQKAFHKYLEIRGIKPSTTNFLQEYMFKKDNDEYLMWLKNLKSFIEK